MLCARICILLLCIQIVFSESCVSYTPCKCFTESNEVIDLTNAGNPEYPRFHDVLFDSGCKETKLYSYNPCFPFNSDNGTIVDSENAPCIGAAACVKSPGGSGGKLPEEHMIGSQASAKFAFNGSYPYINYSVQGFPKNLFVWLTCNNSIDLELKMVEPHCEDDDTVVLNLTSKYACLKPISPSPSPSPSPPQSTPGLSTGSKILIAFFTILLAYLLVGIVWNFCNGAQGIEVIPNIGFWNELPVLIMEGVSFTCSCFGRSSSYGEV